MERTILLLGNPELYEVSGEVAMEELQQMEQVQEDLRDTPVLFINPRLSFPEPEMIDVLDDCMSFPDLLVRVKRYKRCIIYYKDLDWNDCSMELEGDMSELIQHEYDHLDGILATLRAVDERALVMKPH